MANKFKTLVTGGAGLIGSHLVRELIRRGREVIIADDFSRGRREYLADFGISNDFAPVDLTDYNQTKKVMHDIDVVYHLAACIGSMYYLHGNASAELEAFQANTMIDTNVFKACMENNVEKIIYASSTAVYPLYRQYKKDVVIAEDDLVLYPQVSGEINPDGGYGWAKLMGEVQLGYMNNIKAGIARIFNTYGEHENPEIHPRVIIDLMKKALKYPEFDFIVYGDGSQSRDFFYVSDCVDALMKIEDYLNNTHTRLVVNLGSGQGISVKELAESVVKLSGKKIKIEYDVNKEMGPISRTAKIDEIKRLLKWEPRISIELGLLNTYQWMYQLIINDQI